MRRRLANCFVAVERSTGDIAGILYALGRVSIPAVRSCRCDRQAPSALSGRARRLDRPRWPSTRRFARQRLGEAYAHRCRGSGPGLRSGRHSLWSSRPKDDGGGFVLQATSSSAPLNTTPMNLFLPIAATRSSSAKGYVRHDHRLRLDQCRSRLPGGEVAAARRDGARLRLSADPRRQGRQPGARRAARRRRGAPGRRDRRRRHRQVGARRARAGRRRSLRASPAVDGTTGVAIITVNDEGENTIVVSPGANARPTPAQIPAGQPRRAATRCSSRWRCRTAESSPRRESPAAAGARVILSLAPFSPIDAGAARRRRHRHRQRARGGGFRPPSRPRRARRKGGGDGARRRLDRTVIATLGPEGAVAAGPEGSDPRAGAAGDPGRHHRRRRHLCRGARRLSRRGRRP